jgi:hypothetical protein
LLVATESEKLGIKPKKRQVWIDYPVPESFRLFWCDEVTELSRTDSGVKRAVYHSKKILGGELIGTTSTGFNMDPTTKGLLLAHLETGYKREVWEPLREYLDLIKKNNVTIGPIPELGILPLVTGFMVYPKPTHRSLPSRIPNVPFGGKEMVPDEPNKHVEKKIMDKNSNCSRTLC